MRCLSVLAFALLPLAGWSDEQCEDIWFTRNLIMDRAGYCFASPLGQALFDNSDCVGSQVQLDAAAAETVTRIRALEAEYACNVDTRRHGLDMADIAFRRALRDLPLRHMGNASEWACQGWTGPTLPLYDGFSDPLHAIGQILPGDFVSFGHDGPGQGWVYVSVHPPGFSGFKSAGWMYWPDRMPCAAEAG
ncbi:DUF4453 domain-containing protein [Sedimentitalea sp. JM2-8]|uniref:DUF4453 domain-containing protein n=1 Tax=Sedimentitalea xiamensis TaxID=3050037 RepID=A0ABT7FCK2_9RHOB|nr:DUF4453 domain-containing protein [Sedimentitalea xiamensis]MDK3072838.1 DUF4453 domain-containing protein [Sedimentitalea xiamensis]